jgi:hypothetical protein
VSLKTVTDALSTSEISLRDKVVVAQDFAALAETSGRPLRVLQLQDNVETAEFAGVDRVLQITDNFSLIEVADVGTASPRKTRLFLVLGDFALELSGCD